MISTMSRYYLRQNAIKFVDAVGLKKVQGFLDACSIYSVSLGLSTESWSTKLRPRETEYIGVEPKVNLWFDILVSIGLWIKY